MTTVAFTCGGGVRSSATNYAKARAGTGSKSVLNALQAKVGQEWGYSVYQAFFSLLTSAWGDWDAVVNGLEVFHGHGDPCDVELRLYDWGTEVDTGDFIPGDNLGDYVLLASGKTDPASYAELTPTDAFKDLLESVAARPVLMRVALTALRQRTGIVPGLGREPAWSSWSLRLDYTLTELSMVFETEQESETTGSQTVFAFDTEQESETRFRFWTTAPRECPGEVDLYGADRTFLGPLPGSVKTSALRDGADRLQVTFPWSYTRDDGSPDARVEVVRDAHYLVHEGHWYVLDDHSEAVYANRLSVMAYSAETELQGFYTNYSGMPYQKVGTPQEHLDAILGGRPECLWYNGDFAQLDDAGFPRGWIPDDPANWAPAKCAGAPCIEAQAFTDGAAELESFAANMVPGFDAGVKIRFDVWADEGFEGSVELHMLWRSAGYRPTMPRKFPVEVRAGEWSTFESHMWLPVDNAQCSLTLRVQNNTSGHAVRFRMVRFLQKEDPTGWTAYSSMETRDPDVAYNDAGWKLYGAWTHDHANKIVESSKTGDVLARVFASTELLVHFEAGESGSLVDIIIDGDTRVAGLVVETARDYSITGLERARMHTLEIVVGADKKVAVSGAVLSSENLLALTFDRVPVYEALQEMEKAAGGEMAYDTADRSIYYDAVQGYDLTATGVLMLVEAENLASFTPRYGRQSLCNRLYQFGSGEGAFQLGVRVDSNTHDAAGHQSKDLYGVRRLVQVGRELTDAAAVEAAARRTVEAQAWPAQSYESTVAHELAGLIEPGDTVTIAHRVLPEGEQSIRALQVDRSSDGQAATVLWGRRDPISGTDTGPSLMQREIEVLKRVTK